MRRGMQADFSWVKSAQAYADLYAIALARRRGAPAPV
jgi:glycogen synthase